MSEAGDRYRRAREIVLKRYANEKDALGRSQVWKIDAIDNDTKASVDSGLVNIFVDEVEEAFNQLERQEKAVKVPVQAVEEPPVLTEIKPAAPPNNANLGVDLGWD